MLTTRSVERLGIDPPTSLKNSSASRPESRSHASRAADRRSAPYAAAPAPATCRRPHRRPGPGRACSSSTPASASRTIFSAFGSDFPATSCSARPPSGSVTPADLAPARRSSSSEPPPRSPAMPSGLWKPEMTPSAESSASRSPDTRDRHPDHLLGAGEEFGPVAGFARGGGRDRALLPTRIARTSARKRTSAASALSTASSASRPVERTARPSPAQHLFVEISTRRAASPS